MQFERYRKFFEAYLGPLPATDGSGEIQVRSCFRDDPNPSMFINLEDGRYNDFGSDYKGDAYNFYMQMHECTFSAAKVAVDLISGNSEEISKSPIALPIGENVVIGYHSKLMSSANLLQYLVEERGISRDVLINRKIGYDGERYTIPIYNKYEVCINIRRYKPHAAGPDKMMNYKKGYGQARLYPIDALEKDIVFIQEGEWDSLLQESEGFNAITNTAGSGTWMKAWTELFKGKKVYICYDNDSQSKLNSGSLGATKVATALYGVASKVYIITLPLAGTKEDKDVSDYYLKHNNTAQDFMTLVASAKEFKPTEEELDTAGVALPVSLIDARNSKYKHKRVEFEVRVVGKDTAPYNIPSVMKFKCGTVGLNEKMCGACMIGRAGGESDLKIASDPAMLELIRSTKQQQMGLIKRKAGIPQSCAMYESEDILSTNIEEVLLAPEIESFAEWNGEATTYLIQNAFFVSSAIEANRSYKMRGVMTPDPWTQHVTFLLDEAEPLQDSISSFKMTPEIYERLKIYQSENISDKFNEIHKDYEDNVTHIMGRGDLLTGIDLIYHSVLGFNFQGVSIQRGWVEGLCLGDTRTGKSETTTKILHHYQLGEMSVAENTSYAGLVGGLQQTGDKRWFLTWGKLPLNDGRLFVIDEASGLETEDIARMSGIRSSGIAEVTKIQTERTTSRTRLLWLSNPRSGNHLSHYTFGILAVPELIGKAEDISRFDFVVSASRDEVPLADINKRTVVGGKVPHVFNSELSKELILWCWSRTPDQVEFESDAVDAILEYAIKQGTEYSSKIPLIEGANQRIKIARLSVAVATRVFSTDANGEKVIVKKSHVDFTYNYLEQIYSKPSLDYKGFSERELGDTKVAIRSQDEVRVYLDAFPELSDIFDRFELISPQGLIEQLGTSKEAAADHITFFSRTRMIVPTGRSLYKKTAPFISILRSLKQKK